MTIIMRPKVSVIITTYNGTESVENAIQSVLSQTYSEIETIVVDDNGRGTKNQKETELIVKNYPSITYIPHEVNKNGSAARNTGLKVAQGKYVCFLDDDDFFYPERIEKVVERFEQLDETYGIVHNSSRQIFSDKKDLIIEAKAEGEQFRNFISAKFRMGTSNVAFRKTALLEVNGFDDSFARHQDWELMCRILHKYKLGAIDYVGTGRVVENRNAPVNAKKIEDQRLYYLEKMKPYIMTLSPEQQKEVYEPHYIFIAKEYFCEGNMNKYREYARKSGNSIKALYIALRSSIYRGLKRK